MDDGFLERSAFRVRQLTFGFFMNVTPPVVREIAETAQKKIHHKSKNWEFRQFKFHYSDSRQNFLMIFLQELQKVEKKLIGTMMDVLKQVY